MARPTNAELMKKWRRLLEINTREAGLQLDLSPRAIEDIEQGRRRVDDELTRIALAQLIYRAIHDQECRRAALAAVEEREKKSSRRKKTP